MTNLNLDEIERLAKEATTGTWKRDPTDSSNMQVIASGNEVILYHRRHERQVNSQVVPNHSFIAALNPQTALALVARVRELENREQEFLSEFDENVRLHTKLEESMENEEDSTRAFGQFCIKLSTAIEALKEIKNRYLALEPWPAKDMNSIACVTLDKLRTDSPILELNDKNPNMSTKAWSQVVDDNGNPLILPEDEDNI